VPLHAFSEAARLEHFTVYAGEDHGLLQGIRLDQVASLALKDVVFLPGNLTMGQGKDELAMAAQDAKAAAALTQGDSAKAKVTLKDGRTLNLAVAVEGPRPNASLIGKSVQPSASSSASNIQLADPDELPQDAKLTFSLRAQAPAGFAHGEKVEVATADGSSTTTLSVANGGIMLVDSQVGVATLVRLPVLRELKCPATADLACKLSGSNLFLVDSISNDPKFTHPVQVPEGFPGYSLPVPHPTDGPLYVKLRDYPSVINATGLTVLSLPPPPSADELARAEVRHEAHASTTTAPDTSGQTPAPAPTPN
jgi:hypothetical protein